MKRLGDAYIAREADIVFLPALAPMEAAMLPALQAPCAYRPIGALAHVRASFEPGQTRAKRPSYRLKLRGWGNQRQKI